jgi:hypothetical protein
MSVFLGGMSGSCYTGLGATKIFPDILKRGNNIWFRKGNVLINFQKGSKNSKTGLAIQNYLIPKSWGDAGEILDDKDVCFDCPHSQSKNATCYVRKGTASWGLKSKAKALKSFVKLIPEFSQATEDAILKMCEGQYVRFGAYGEPILLGEDLVKKITKVAKTWTGYTHQWHQDQYQWAKKYFMASVDSLPEKSLARSKGWRPFFVSDDPNYKMDKTDSVLCPASAQAGKKLQCNACSLCKGTSAKNKAGKLAKDVEIPMH